eukprot:TRINITY_DN3146_c0_g1_i1.p1 TRINITY_DN3146_c0_g1~~TRINITY_DN3146_c0_g1_i1.p1  ORF type:complete len:146 (+),score=28.52 TRINITY_DN3146_c0_g1_i1:40-438(+)
MSSSQDSMGDAPKEVTKRLGPIFYYTDTTAVKFQTFQVTKVNKFGKSQERTMGIDDKRITNSSVEKPTKVKVDKVKVPERPLSDVTKVWINPAKTQQFFIQFKDKVAKFESDKTDEIVAKLSYLLKLSLIHI